MNKSSVLSTNIAKYTKDNPFLGTITKHILLTPAPSTRRTYHIEIDITGSGLKFQPGDSIGILPKNPSKLVQKILQVLSLNPTDSFFHKKTQKNFTYFEFIQEHVNLKALPNKILQHVLGHHSDSKIAQLLNPEKKPELKHYIKQFELWDFLESHATNRMDPLFILQSTLPLLPRYYSIANSPKEDPHRIDILVSSISYETNQIQRTGVASQYLNQDVSTGEKVSLFLLSNPNFKLPKDPHVPIIMIGPGTGIAPYRAFLQERLLHNNWLFFGERHSLTDFYYEDFFQSLEQQKRLILTTAFSRDQKEKIYVQHLLYQHRQLFWEWIQNGAILYLCGDASHMAKDVTSMLETIFIERGCLNTTEAKHQIKEMRKNKRFIADVY